MVCDFRFLGYFGWFSSIFVAILGFLGFVLLVF